MPKDGAPIALCYPPSRPQDAVVDNPTPYWVIGMVIGAFAILFSLLTLDMGRKLFRRIRRAHRRP